MRPKCLGRKECLTMWIQSGVQFIVQYLRTQLLQMILDPHLKSNILIRLEKRTVLPKLVEVAPWMLIKDKEKF